MKKGLLIMGIIFTVLSVTPVSAAANSTINPTGNVKDQTWKDVLTLKPGATLVSRTYDFKTKFLTTSYDWTSIVASDPNKIPEFNVKLEKKGLFGSYSVKNNRIVQVPLKTRNTVLNYGEVGKGTFRFTYNTGSTNYPTGSFTASPYIIMVKEY